MLMALSAVHHRNCRPAIRTHLMSWRPLISSRSPLLPTAQPEWLKVISDMEADIGSSLRWGCAAAGKPRPTVRWLRNGEPLASQVGDLGFPPILSEWCGAGRSKPRPSGPAPLAAPLGQFQCHREVLGASFQPRDTWSQAGQLDRPLTGGFRHNSDRKTL